VRCTSTADIPVCWNEAFLSVAGIKTHGLTRVLWLGIVRRQEDIPTSKLTAYKNVRCTSTADIPVCWKNTTNQRTGMCAVLYFLVNRRVNLSVINNTTYKKTTLVEKFWLALRGTGIWFKFFKHWCLSILLLHLSKIKTLFYVCTLNIGKVKEEKVFVKTNEID
jgi:hypothetical protein